MTQELVMIYPEKTEPCQVQQVNMEVLFLSQVVTKQKEL